MSTEQDTAYAFAWWREHATDPDYVAEANPAKIDGGLQLFTRLALDLSRELSGWHVRAEAPCPGYHNNARLVFTPPNGAAPPGIECRLYYDKNVYGWQHRMFHSRYAPASIAAYAAGWLITVQDCALWWKAIETACPVDASSVWAYITEDGGQWVMQRDQGDTTLVLRGSFIFDGVIELSVAKGRWTTPGKAARSVFRSELRVGQTTAASEALARVCSELHQIAQDLIVLGSSFSPRIEQGAAFTNMIDVRDLARTMVPPVLKVGCVFENLGTPKFNIFREGVCPASITCDRGDGQKPLPQLLNEAAPVLREQIALMLAATPAKETP